MTNEENITPEVQATVPEKPTGADMLSFTQEQFDAIIKDRLARERNKYKDYDELRQKAAEYDKKKRAEMDEIERLRADLELIQKERDSAKAFQEAFTATLQRRIEQIPESERKRIPEFDDPRKTMAWLDNNRDLFERPRPPETDAGVIGDKIAPGIKLTAEQERLRQQMDVPEEDFRRLLAERHNKAIRPKETGD